MKMKKYYRIILGEGNKFAKQCLEGNFIGVDYGFPDLTVKLHENWKDFNKEFIPIFLKIHPSYTKIGAGLACGMTHTVIRGLQIGDIVLCPNGLGSYSVGEILDNYSFHSGEILPHRRTVKWYPGTLTKEEMSEGFQQTLKSSGAVITIERFAEELENFINGYRKPTILSTDDTIEDPSVFALEKHLEEFLVQNWKHTEFGKLYDIYEEEGELVGQQYPSDTGPIDILAISKDKKNLLIVELKKGRASDL
jgi:restriction system protein